MKSFPKFSILLFIFSITLCAQAQSRREKIEEMRNLDSKIEQMQKQLDQMQERQDEIRDEILSVSNEDKAEADKIGATAVRLFPDKSIDDLVENPDGGSIYIFDELANFYFAPRIEYKNGALEFVKGEKNLGFIANIGTIQFEKIDEQNREVIALAKYQPPTEFKDAKSEYISSNLTFRNKVSVSVGNIFLARIVRYGEGDAIFAIKVQRKDTDESIILFIKEIQTFEPPKEKNIASTEQPQKQEDSNKIPNYEIVQKVQNAMLINGFYDVTVDGSTTPITLRGSIPKGKMAEVVQAAVEAAGGKPIRNEMTEK